MIDVYLETKVARRTHLTSAWNEDGKSMYVGKTVSEVVDWAIAQGHRQMRIWTDQSCLIGVVQLDAEKRSPFDVDTDTSG